MKFPNFYVFRNVVPGGREALRRKMQTLLAVRFQVHSHALPH